MVNRRATRHSSNQQETILLCTKSLVWDHAFGLRLFGVYVISLVVFGVCWFPLLDVHKCRVHQPSSRSLTSFTLDNNSYTVVDSLHYLRVEAVVMLQGHGH